MKLFKTLLAVMTLVAGTMFGALQAWAAEYTLVISSWAPPSHGINAILWPNLTKMIEEATDGRVTTEIKYGLAPPPAQPDLRSGKPHPTGLTHQFKHPPSDRPDGVIDG